jgi:hypothetical protein
MHPQARLAVRLIRTHRLSVALSVPFSGGREGDDLEDDLEMD